MANTKDFLNLEHIYKTYSDGYVAVSDINFSVNKGEFVTLLGPSGCGKTTILKIIAGFEQPTSGRIIFNGKDIKNLPINKRPTATVFQDYALFPNMNVYQNIAYGLKLMRKQNQNISDIDKKKEDAVYANAVKIAYKHIKDIETDIQKTLRDKFKLLEKVKSFSSIDPKHIESNKYEGLYLKEINNLKNKMNKSLKSTQDQEVLILSFKNKWNEFKWKLKNLFNLPLKPVNYDLRKLNEYQTLALQNRANYLFNKKANILINKINKKINDLDNQRSYWENYPTNKLEQFQNHYTSRKLTKKEIHDAVINVIQTVGLQRYELKYPEDLSGGMKQRVALARAIVVEPQILLLDEPLSSLDAKVRQQMQLELKRLHQKLNLTFILVTHDQEEALFLSNKIIVMSKGKIEQIDSPKRIYDAPNNLWVANFIGETNLFVGEILDNGLVDIEDVEFNIANINKKYTPGSLVNIIIRPEDIQVVNQNEGTINGKVTQCVYKGAKFELVIKTNTMNINVNTINQYEVGTIVGLKWDLKAMRVISYVDNKETINNENK